MFAENRIQAELMSFSEAMTIPQKPQQLTSTKV